MLRSTRPLLKAPARVLPRASGSIAPYATSQTRKPTSGAPWRAQLPAAAPSRRLVPFVQRANFADKNVRDTNLEKKIGQQKLESHPEEVTVESSVRPSYEGPETRPSDPNTTDGVKKDLVRGCPEAPVTMIYVARLTLVPLEKVDRHV